MAMPPWLRERARIHTGTETALIGEQRWRDRRGARDGGGEIDPLDGRSFFVNQGNARLQDRKRSGGDSNGRELTVLQRAARQTGATVVVRRRRNMRATAPVQAARGVDDMSMYLLRPRGDVLRIEGMQKRRTDRAERREQRPQQCSAAEGTATKSAHGQPGGVTHGAHA